MQILNAKIIQSDAKIEISIFFEAFIAALMLFPLSPTVTYPEKLSYLTGELTLITVSLSFTGIFGENPGSPQQLCSW